MSKSSGGAGTGGRNSSVGLRSELGKLTRAIEGMEKDARKYPYNRDLQSGLDRAKKEREILYNKIRNK